MSVTTKSGEAKSRGRIARARHIQHALATGQVAASRAHADELSASRRAVQLLKDDLSVNQGVQDAASIARQVELRARLDAAEDSLILAIAEAEADLIAHQYYALARRVDQNAAEKLHQRALRALKMEAENRAARTLCPRRPGVLAR